MCSDGGSQDNTETLNEREKKKKTDQRRKTEDREERSGRDSGIQPHGEQRTAVRVLSQLASVSLGLGTGW